MFTDIVLPILGMTLGLALLIKGADFFVDGSKGIATALRIPPLIIGLTLVSMGTSAPEASVGIIGSLNGMNDLAVGNVVGSNLFNTLPILGISALVAELTVSNDMRKYDIPITAGLYLLLLLFAFVITPYTLDIAEGIVLLALFALYTAFLIIRSKRGGKQSEVCTQEQSPALPSPKTDRPLWLNIVFAVSGLAGVIGGGTLVVDNASVIAKTFGMSEMLVGLTVVAIGTSLPELVTSIVASVKKETDIAVGNVIGSNIFNILFILGTSSVISPPAVGADMFADMLVLLGSGIILLACALFSKKIRRWQGALLILLYVAYFSYIIIRN